MERKYSNVAFCISELVPWSPDWIILSVNKGRELWGTNSGVNCTLRSSDVQPDSCQSLYSVYDEHCWYSFDLMTSSCPSPRLFPGSPETSTRGEAPSDGTRSMLYLGAQQGRPGQQNM